MDSGERDCSCLGLHNVSIDFISIAGVASPLGLVDLGVTTAVDALGILIHPLPYFFQNLHRFLWNTAFCIRTHIQEQVSALADTLNQHVDDHLG